MEAVKASLAQDSLKALTAPYRPRSPKETLFYQVISQHFPQFLKKLEDQSGEASVSLPDHVQAEFDAYLRCGILEHGFVKMACLDCRATLLVPLHTEEIETLLKTIQKRMVRHLIKRGVLSKYENDPVPDLNEEMNLFNSLQGSSVLGRIGTGENQGKKVRSIGSFGTETESAFKSGPCAATLAGFSLHAATYIKEDKRDRLETLCRYLLRPPVSEKRLTRINNGDVVLQLKSEWSDGTRAMEFTPHEFIEKLIAIIPPPRIHGVRFHGILAPSAEDRRKIVPAVSAEALQGELFECHKKNPKPKKVSWAELLKRTFQIDLSQCLVCGGVVKFQKAVLKKSEILDTLTLANLSPTPE